MVPSVFPFLVAVDAGNGWPDHGDCANYCRNRAIGSEGAFQGKKPCGGKCEGWKEQKWTGLDRSAC